jgi:hypothetical protein
MTTGAAAAPTATYFLKSKLVAALGAHAANANLSYLVAPCTTASKACAFVSAEAAFQSAPGVLTDAVLPVADWFSARRAKDCIDVAKTAATRHPFFN